MRGRKRSRACPSISSVLHVHSKHSLMVCMPINIMDLTLFGTPAHRTVRKPNSLLSFLTPPQLKHLVPNSVLLDPLAHYSVAPGRCPSPGQWFTIIHLVSFLQARTDITKSLEANMTKIYKVRPVLLASTPLFLNWDLKVLEDLVTKLEPFVFAEKQVMVKQGDLGTCLFIIARGKCESVIRTGVCTCVLLQGLFPVYPSTWFTLFCLSVMDMVHWFQWRNSIGMGAIAKLDCKEDFNLQLETICAHLKNSTVLLMKRRR